MQLPPQLMAVHVVFAVAAEELLSRKVQCDYLESLRSIKEIKIETG